MRRTCCTVLFFGLIGLGLGTVSCRSTPPPEPGTSVYSRGVLRATVENPLDEVVRATQKALKTLQLKPMGTQRDGFSAEIVGEVSYGPLESSEIRVRLSRLSESTTEIHMRILFRRDETRMRQVLEEIQKNL